MPLFHVVRLEPDGNVICGHGSGIPYIWDNALNATHWAQDQEACTGIKHQIRPVKSDIDWRKRELERFDSGHYTKLPWHNEEWVAKATACKDHFPHVSRNDPILIAYTLNEENGDRDAKSVVRASKYLMNNYGKILSEEVIRSWVAEHKKLYEDTALHFAYTASSIERVYKRGPHSCMSEPAKRSRIHPATVYEGPDLAIAYAEKQKKIVARCVCWPKKKIYGRLYGDGALLQSLLEEEGYVPGTMEGARLTKVKEGNRYVCPYIDGIKKVRVGKKYLKITALGNRSAANQDGYCGVGFRCGFCHEDLDGEKPETRIAIGSFNNARIVVEGTHWCQPCFDKETAAKNVARCAHTGHYYRMAHLMVMHDGRHWHSGLMHNAAFKCVTCNLNYDLNLRAKNMGYTPDRRWYLYQCKDCSTRQKEMPF